MAGLFNKFKPVKAMTINTIILEKAILSAIESMKEEFDTHQLILEVAKKNQRAYVAALHESDSDYAFQTVHSAIGKLLKRISLEPYANIIEKEQTSNSLNIFGEYSSCSSWAKL
jgi:hypothetical protein